MKQALIVIDIQNDYFPEGNYSLWRAEETLVQAEAAITQALQHDMLIVYVQHIANPDNGSSPFFNEGTTGVALHPRLLAASPLAQVVIKRHADSFYQTNLDEILQAQGVRELFLCGMMTQNCVTHTALSKSAEKYQVSILADCCTTVDEMIHEIALGAIAHRVPLKRSNQAWW